MPKLSSPSSSASVSQWPWPDWFTALPRTKFLIIPTTVQPKAIAHPTDARLCHRALEELVDLAQRNNMPLRQSYRRVAKRAAIMVGRYTHAHQFKRVRRSIKFLRTASAG